MVSCNNNSSETPPSNIITEQQFTKILSEFLISESVINLNIKNITNLKFDSVYAFNPLIENNISKGKYDSTLQYYSKHPELYKQIYEDALELLSQMQIQRRAKVVADSLQTIKIKKDSIQAKRNDSLKAITTKNKNAK
jgi:hypothetical protein